MQWVRGCGPAGWALEDAAFEELVRTGVVRDDTPIWREGLADWCVWHRSSSASGRGAALPLLPLTPAPVEATRLHAVRGTISCRAIGFGVNNRQMCPACRQASAPAPAPVACFPARCYQKPDSCTQCGGRFTTALVSMVGKSANVAADAAVSFIAATTTRSCESRAC